MTEILVIGIGNEMRGDDAAGLLAARRIKAAALPDVTVRESAGDPAGLMEAWRGARKVCVIDCCAPMGEPGRIHRFDARAAPLPEVVRTHSSHGAGLGMAIELARTLGALPPELTVFAIEGRAFDHGATPTPAIAKTIDAVTFLVSSEICHTLGTIAGMIAS